MIFELRIKAKVSNCIYKCARFVFCFFAVHKLNRTLEDSILQFFSWHITILFPVLYVNM